VIVLGLSQMSPHDPSAALLVDGQVVACVEQERFSRRKHAINEDAIDAARACLELAGLVIDDVDVIAIPFDMKNIQKLRFAGFRRSFRRRGRKAVRLLFKGDKRGRRARENAQNALQSLGGDPQRTKIVQVEHHFAHASSAFFFSGMESAAIMTIDGEGELTTTLFGEADLARGLRPSLEIPRPDSLGLFYTAITEFLGFRKQDGEYKTMGMAPYGDAEKADLTDILRFGDGDFWLDTDYLHPHRSVRYEGKLFSHAFVERFGPPRTGDALSEPYIHIAAAAQKRLEDVSLHMLEAHLAEPLRRNGGRLCFAGGCALNVVLNRKLIAHPMVEELYVQPAAGDSGLSVGAAAYVAHQHGEKIAPMTHAYWGPEYSQETIEAALHAAELPFVRVEDPANTAAELLHAGHVVAWFQGRMEWGPRALGNRSILGNPALRGTADHINEQIKFRETWRPFCPSVLAEYGHEIVETEHDSPFMTFSFRVKDAWAKKIPEIVHVDGTARPQFVYRESNPLFHSLIDRFRELSGFPVVINTSLNRRGEPMVCSPEDATAMFQGSGLTHMLIGNALVTRGD
jgi:carbamoyltransferase